MAEKKASLSIAEKEKIVEEYLGVHPKYLRPSGTVINILVNQHDLETGRRFTGFKDHQFPAVIADK